MHNFDWGMYKSIPRFLREHMKKCGGIYLLKNWCLKLTKPFEPPEHTHTGKWIIILELTCSFGFLKGIISPCL